MSTAAATPLCPHCGSDQVVPCERRSREPARRTSVRRNFCESCSRHHVVVPKHPRPPAREGRKAFRPALSDDAIRAMRELVAAGHSTCSVAEMLDVAASTVGRHCRDITKRKRLQQARERARQKRERQALNGETLVDADNPATHVTTVYCSRCRWSDERPHAYKADPWPVLTGLAEEHAREAHREKWVPVDVDRRPLTGPRGVE